MDKHKKIIFQISYEKAAEWKRLPLKSSNTTSFVSHSARNIYQEFYQGLHMFKFLDLYDIMLCKRRKA